MRLRRRMSPSDGCPRVNSFRGHAKQRFAVYFLRRVERIRIEKPVAEIGAADLDQVRTQLLSKQPSRRK
jgi:hypothetical protein